MARAQAAVMARAQEELQRAQEEVHDILRVKTSQTIPPSALMSGYQIAQPGAFTIEHKIPQPSAFTIEHKIPQPGAEPEAARTSTSAFCPEKDRAYAAIAEAYFMAAITRHGDAFEKFTQCVQKTSPHTQARLVSELTIRAAQHNSVEALATLEAILDDIPPTAMPGVGRARTGGMMGGPIPTAMSGMEELLPGLEPLEVPGG
jgi:hypothetical protein